MWIPMRVASFGMLAMALALSAASSVRAESGATCPVPAATRTDARSASRQNTFQQIENVHDCLVKNAHSPTTPALPIRLRFWTLLLDAAILLEAVGFAAWVAGGGTTTRNIAYGLAAIASLCVLSRIALNGELTSDATASRERLIAAAEARWQLQMIRARHESNDENATSIAVAATERLVSASMGD